MSKKFPIGAVLSVAQPKLLCDIGELYGILNYMTGENLMTHQLPRASKECKPVLLRMHPQLADIDHSGINPNTWREKLAELEARFGSELEVPQCREGEDYIAQDPIQEAVEMFGKDRVIAIGRDDDPTPEAQR